MSLRALLEETVVEAHRCVSEWSDEHPADGTGGRDAERAADTMRSATAQAFAEGRGTWRMLLMERVLEAFALDGPLLRDELVGVAGMAICWADDVERRSRAPTLPAHSVVAMKSSG